VLCVDEKSQAQALDRSQPVLPMMPACRASHSRLPAARRHSLFAAFNIATGRHQRPAPAPRAIEFKKFLIRIDKAVPAELDVHLVLRQLRPPQDS